MTEQEIPQQIDELRSRLDEMNARLDEVRAGNDAPSADASLTEDERERQHQEDLQRLRGLRLIDDDFMNACFDAYTEGAELLLRVILDKRTSA